ncbi:MAG: transporter substrate-binding domain-containing protein [Desulfamplus sp.]|nr:transporter substrate-binding domain-containing protein [Desulfamplus sp.]
MRETYFAVQEFESNNNCCKANYILILSVLALLFLSHMPDANAGQKIKIGVYNFSPLVFIDDTGTASGFFPDILNYIAQKEDWEITYIPGSWSECLTRIENKEIDLQVSIAYSAKRAEQLDFSDYLIMDWATVFKQKGSPIQTIFDLQDKTVSVVKSGITTDNFKQILDQFNITCNMVEKNENRENLKAVHDKEADAGVCPNIYGTMVENGYDIERTPIVFSPIRLGFATPKDTNREILSILNRYIAELKADRGSVYYDLRNKWTGYGNDKILPKWLLPALLILLCLFVMLALFNIALKRKVKTKTSELVAANRELSLSEDRYRILFEQAMQDIEERKLAEAALKQSEEIFSYFMKYSPVYVFFKDDQIRSLRLSSNYETMLDRPLEELLGKTMYDLFPSDLARRMVADDLRILKENREIVVEEEFNGRHYSTIKFPIHIKGKPCYLAGYTIDITDRKRAEEESHKLQQQLLQAQKVESIGRLAGGVAHDFNNMLGVIIGHTEMLLNDLDTKESAYHGLSSIHKAASRSADLTKQLLAFARKQTVNPQVVDLNNSVEGLISMLVRLIGEDIDLVWTGSANAGMVKIDPAQIDQIMINLCINARDAIHDKGEHDKGEVDSDYKTGKFGKYEMPDMDSSSKMEAGEKKDLNRLRRDTEEAGKITIETDNAFFDKADCADNVDALPGSYVMLAVSDNGCGMDSKRVSMIFDPFFTTKEVDKGTGLGLASVYGIVRQNNGFINVYSEPGKGTTFRIYLPVYIGQHRDSLSNDSIESTSILMPESENKSKTILLVEDEISLLELGESMLKRLGYKVLTAATPKEAIDITHACSGQIDLLITDVIMPGMNGRDLASQLIQINPSLRSLFMSGYTADIIAHHGVLDQGVNFIQKPFSMQELSDKIREIV